MTEFDIKYKAKLSDEDAILSTLTWYICDGEAYTYVAGLKRSMLHLVVKRVQPGKPFVVTNINGDLLDCRRENLRWS